MRLPGLRGFVALAALLGLGLIWLFAPGAAAGGPTSVLLTSPESSRTASLYNDSADYEKLQRLLGRVQPGGAGAKAPPLSETMGQRQINVTWLVHDVTPWRVDRIYLPLGPGSQRKPVMIHTADGVPDSFKGVWHKAENGPELRELLGKLGLLGPASPDGAKGVPPPADPPAQSTEVTISTDEPDEPAAGGDSTDWWWAALSGAGPGVAVGAVGGALMVRRRWAGQGGDDDPPGPRQELIEL